jgi:hypothetical protein
LCGQTPQKPEKTGFAPDQKGLEKPAFFVALQQKTLDLTSIDPILISMLRRNKNKTQ